MHVEVCALVLEACDLLERAETHAPVEPAVLDDAACLRQELCAAVAAAADEGEAADGRSAVAALDLLLMRQAGNGLRLTA